MHQHTSLGEMGKARREKPSKHDMSSKPFLVDLAGIVIVSHVEATRRLGVEGIRAGGVWRVGRRRHRCLHPGPASKPGTMAAARSRVSRGLAAPTALRAASSRINRPHSVSLGVSGAKTDAKTGGQQVHDEVLLRL